MSGGHSPLSQFEIIPLIALPRVAGYDVAFTNSALFMVLTVLAIGLFLALPMRRAALVPGRWQSMAEMTYQLVAGMVRDNVGKEGMKYFPFIFSLFLFVLFANLLGMLPYSFTVTSHIIVTFALAATVFLVVNIVAFARHGLHFFHFFLPHGTPLWLAPFLVMVEFFSYLARPISLSIRLAANMLAGHTLLKIMAGFIGMMGVWGLFAPFPMLLVLTGFELMVALLQAYIFTILTCIYLHDAIHMH